MTMSIIIGIAIFAILFAVSVFLKQEACTGQCHGCGRDCDRFHGEKP